MKGENNRTTPNLGVILLYVMNMLTTEYRIEDEIAVVREEVERDKAIDTAKKLLAKKFPAADIAESVGIPLDEVKALANG